MVAKHVHATVITRLHQYVRDPVQPEAERREIDRYSEVLPARTGFPHYLFEDGLVRERAARFVAAAGI